MTYEDAVAAFAAGMFAAVAYLHERGIAHRDLKPSNVLLGPSGHPYLLDFNLASRVADPWRLAGTLPYMAPEQLAVLAEPATRPPADGRAGDVFACGVVLFELLTGRHPFGEPGAFVARPDREWVAGALLAAAGGTPAPGGPQSAGPAGRLHGGRALPGPRPAGSRPTASELAELFSRAGLRRPARFTAPVLAGAGVLALALGFVALRPSDPPPAPPEAPPVTAAPTPTAPASPFERGLVLFRQEQYGLAAGDFLEAGKAEKDGRAYGYAAYCLSVARAPAEALVPADEAIRLGSRTAPVYANRAYNNYKLGRLEEAQADCDEAIRLDPDLPAPRFTRAVVHLAWYNRKRTVIPFEALADIDRATAGMPNAPEVWSVAAELYLLAPDAPGAEEKAIEAVRRAVLAGKAADQLRRKPVLQAREGHPAFEAALKQPPGPAAPPVNPHLANPIP